MKYRQHTPYATPTPIATASAAFFLHMNNPVVFSLKVNYTISKKFIISHQPSERMLEMLAELRAKSQITIPKELVEKLGIKEGDKLEITEKDGAIQLVPVVVYPKKLVEDLKTEIEEVKGKLAGGTQPVFDSIESLFKELEP